MPGYELNSFTTLSRYQILQHVKNETKTESESHKRDKVVSSLEVRKLIQKSWFNTPHDDHRHVENRYKKVQSTGMAKQSDGAPELHSCVGFGRVTSWQSSTLMPGNGGFIFKVLFSDLFKELWGCQVKHFKYMFGRITQQCNLFLYPTA